MIGRRRCEFWAHRRTTRRIYVPMTDLSILCLHNSTTSWESQQRGGIVEDVIGGGGGGVGGVGGYSE